MNLLILISTVLVGCVVVVVAIKKVKIARIFFHRYLSSWGVQIGNHIHTPVSTIYSYDKTLDIVHIIKSNSFIKIKYMISSKCLTIPLKYVPPNHKLIYSVNGENKDIPYEDGTPFSVFDGELILYRKERKSLGYIMEEICKSKSWPIDISA